ncbi:MAG: hypothetical protein JO099_17975 [Acidobacteriia bacterium]|nr:hypothetical protein [Terriglobia bacterium]
MDVALQLKRITNTALFIGGALLLAGLGQAQTLQTSTTTVTLVSQASQMISISTVPANSAISFTVSQTGSFFTVRDQNDFPISGTLSTTTTTGLTLQAANVNCLNTPSGCSGTVILQDAHSASDKVTITVMYSNTGTGGGGTSILTTTAPNGLSISASAGGVGQGSFQILSSSSAATTFNVTFTYTTGTGWLSASVLSGTVTSGSPVGEIISASAVGLVNGVYSGSVVITPTGSVQSAISVPITFTVGITGVGTLSASQTTVALTYPTGTTSQTISLTSSSGAISYTAVAMVAANVPQWLVLNGTGSSTVSGIPLSSGLIVGAGLGATNLGTGTYSGYVTVTASDGSTVQINVNLTVNGGTVGGVSLSQNSLIFTATAGTTTVQTGTVTVTVPTGNTISATVATGSPWLSVNTASSGSSATLTVSINPSSLAATTYLGSITITTNPGGTTQTQAFAVTLIVGGTGTTGTGNSVLAAPTALSFYFQTSGAVPPSQYLAIGGGSTFTVSTGVLTPASGNWLTAAQYGGTNEVVVTVTPTGLAAQATPYQGTVTISSGGTSQTVIVNLTVTTGPVLYTNPGTVALTYTSGSSAPSATVFVSSSDGSAFTITSATPTASWITAQATTSSVTISTSPSGLATGVYSGAVNLAISGPSYANIPFTIPVGLVVNGGIGTGPLLFSSSVLTFTPQPNGAAVSQSLTVSASTTTAFSLSSTPATGTSWLTISANQTVTPAVVTVTVNPAGLSAGQTYNGSITFSANGTVQSVPVVVVVGGGATLSVSPTSLSFSGTAGGAATATQPVTVSSNGAQLGFTVSTSATWLQVDKTSGTTQATVNVSANPSGLSAGPQTGTVTITPNGGGTAATVSVTFMVMAAPTVTVSSSTLTFQYSAGGATPAAQTVTVSGAAFTASAAVSTPSGGSWLAVAPTSGAAGSTVSISVNPSGLAIGSYSGTVTLTANGGGTATISVTLNVTAPLPTITGVINAASGYSASISPGEIITIFGTNIGPATPVTSAQLNSNGLLATQLGGVQVLVNGYLAPMANVSSTQVSAIVPYELAPYQSAAVEIRYLGQSSNGIVIPVSTTAPGIFTQNQQGTGPAAFNANFSVNGPSNPTTKGGYAVFYLTGEGQTNPLGVTGTINPAGQKGPAPLLPVTVTLNGQPLPAANILYAGGVPGSVEGLMQLNIQIPTTAASGALPIAVTIGNNSTQSGVTVSVQ